MLTSLDAYDVTLILWTDRPIKRTIKDLRVATLT